MTVATVQKPGRSNLDYDSIAPNFFFFKITASFVLLKIKVTSLSLAYF